MIKDNNFTHFNELLRYLIRIANKFSFVIQSKDKITDTEKYSSIV
jgi:hypothetical protein